MEWLAGESKKYYEKLIRTEGFITFFRQATPIDAIETSKIGSRPAKRTGANTLEDLRAIPWVFSWSQSRYHMTSWFGMGSAMESLQKNRPEEYETLKSALKKDSFVRYVFTNVDTSIAATDREIMKSYADLVEDAEVRDVFWKRISNELELAEKHLMELLGRSFEQRRSSHFYSNKLRASLMDFIHYKQIDLLKKWRKQKAEEHEDVNKTQIELMLTINAIASANRNTG
jgi:phosphoenolpyruvate carboxylase